MAQTDISKWLSQIAQFEGGEDKKSQLELWGINAYDTFEEVIVDFPNEEFVKQNLRGNIGARAKLIVALKPYWQACS